MSTSNLTDNRQQLWVRLGLLIAVAASSAMAGGCSLCCGPYDRDYGAFGGIVERNDPAYGRVGSVFSDPNVVRGPSADSNVNEFGSEERRQREMERRSRSRELLDRGSEEPLPDPVDEEVRPGEVDTADSSWRNRPLRSNEGLR